MENLLDALNQFKERRVIVIGDVLLDQSLRGSIDRLNPEIPAVPLVKVSGIDYRLGGAANVARNLASLGATCHLFGQIGRDAYGDKITELCAAEGIKTYFVDSGRGTIVKQRVFSDGHYLARIDFGEDKLIPITSNLEKVIEREIIKDMNLYDLIIFSDYDKGIFGGNLARVIIEAGISRRILTLADLKPTNINAFLGCDIIRLNRKEAEEVAGRKYDGNNLREIATILAEKTHSKYVVITCGAEGAFTYDIEDTEKGISQMVRAKKIEIGDATGAGDTFAAVLGLGMASKINFEESIRLANYASAIVVGKIGTAVTSIEELRSALKES